MDSTILWLSVRLCQNFTSVSIILFEIYAVKEHHCRAGSSLEMDSGHKNNKTSFYPGSTTIFMDFLRCRRFSYIHAQGTFCASREDAFSALVLLRSQSSVDDGKVKIWLRVSEANEVPACLAGRSVFLLMVLHLQHCQSLVVYLRVLY